MGRIRVNLKSLRELVCFSILFEGCSTYKVALVSSQFLQDGPSVLWICFASSPWVSSFSVSSTVLACTPGLGYRLFANEVTSFGERLEAVWVFGPFCYERKKKKKALNTVLRQGVGKKDNELHSEWCLSSSWEDRQVGYSVDFLARNHPIPGWAMALPLPTLPACTLYPAQSPDLRNIARWRKEVQASSCCLDSRRLSKMDGPE